MNTVIRSDEVFDSKVLLGSFADVGRLYATKAIITKKALINFYSSWGGIAQ